MKRTLNQKTRKTGEFIMGLRYQVVTKSLSKHGFSEADRDEGVGHFGKVARNRINRTPGRSQDNTALIIVDRFENTWFPIARLSLARRFPAVAGALFMNLNRANGKPVVWNVTFFLERVQEMNDPNGTFGPDGPAARALLEKRGLTAEVIATVTLALAELDAYAAPEIASDEQTDEDRKAAEDAMWAWYLEWSGIARRVIKDSNVLRLLGLGKRRSASTSSDSDEAEEIEAEGEVVAPLPALPAARSSAVVGKEIAAE